MLSIDVDDKMEHHDLICRYYRHDVLLSTDASSRTVAAAARSATLGGRMSSGRHDTSAARLPGGSVLNYDPKRESCCCAGTLCLGGVNDCVCARSVPVRKVVGRASISAKRQVTNYTDSIGSTVLDSWSQQSPLLVRSRSLKEQQYQTQQIPDGMSWKQGKCLKEETLYIFDSGFFQLKLPQEFVPITSLSFEPARMVQSGGN
ncbi:hypothetical protein CBL_03263 [Carabus blaptoides fortunei]